MEIKPIRTKADHRAALKEIETLMNARAGTPDGEECSPSIVWVASARSFQLRSLPVFSSFSSR